MAEIVERAGNIFRSNCDSVVVTVNCEGVMGAGIALDARLRWPALYEIYAQACDSDMVRIGRPLFVQRADAHADVDVICFPTKNRWRNPSKLSYIVEGLAGLRELVVEHEVRSIAVPRLGCSHGGLVWSQVRPVVVRALDDMPIEVELWRYEEEPDDPLFGQLRSMVSNASARELAQRLGLGLRQSETLIAALRLESVIGLQSLHRVPGIGAKTLEAVYRALFHPPREPEQTELPL